MDKFTKLVIGVTAWLDFWVLLSIFGVDSLPFPVKVLSTTILWIVTSILAWLIVEDR